MLFPQPHTQSKLQKTRDQILVLIQSGPAAAAAAAAAAALFLIENREPAYEWPCDLRNEKRSFSNFDIVTFNNWRPFGIGGLSKS